MFKVQVSMYFYEVTKIIMTSLNFNTATTLAPRQHMHHLQESIWLT